MNDYEKSLVEKSRNYTVVKSNAIVLNSRYRYSLNQQKMIAFICSKIKPAFDNVAGAYQLEYEFEIADYIRLLGNQSTGDIYNETKAILKSLRDKSFWMELPDGSETTVSWINKVTLSKRSGRVKYRLDEDLAPYLFELKERYLSYGLINILNFKSKYSIRLYEMLKTHYDMKRGQYRMKLYQTPVIEWTLELDQIRHMLMLDTEEDQGKLSRFADFRRKVIEIAQEEINDLSDMHFDFEPITKGKKTVMIKFLIKAKDNVQRAESQTKNNALFD